VGKWWIRDMELKRRARSSIPFLGNSLAVTALQLANLKTDPLRTHMITSIEALSVYHRCPAKLREKWGGSCAF